jgi:hypothetical protein
VAAGAEIAATAVVGVVGEEWEAAEEDGAVVVRRPRRCDESEALRLFLHENDSSKRYPVCDNGFYMGAIWEGCLLFVLSWGGTTYTISQATIHVRCTYRLLRTLFFAVFGSREREQLPPAEVPERYV